MHVTVIQRRSAPQSLQTLLYGVITGARNAENVQVVPLGLVAPVLLAVPPRCAAASPARVMARQVTP